MISTRNILFSTASLVVAASALTVSSPPSMVQCQPVQLSWSDGTAPFYVAIIPGGQPTAAALENLPTQQGESVTWMVDLAAGQEVTIKVTDSTGTINYSDSTPIQAGTSTTCVSGDAAAVASSSDDATSAAPAAAAVTSSTSLSMARSRASSAATSATGAASAAASSATSSAGSVTSAIGAKAAAATTAGSTGAATSVKAGLGMLIGGLLFALAA